MLCDDILNALRFDSVSHARGIGMVYSFFKNAYYYKRTALVYDVVQCSFFLKSVWTLST